MKTTLCLVSEHHHYQIVCGILLSFGIIMNIWALVPLVTPTSSPIMPIKRQQEVVLFVGYPCLGKSTFYRRHFQPEEYVHINQDTLKTSQKCAKVLQEAIKDGKSCVIGAFASYFSYESCVLTLHFLDNTNRNAATRKAYLDICKANNVKSR